MTYRSLALSRRTMLGGAALVVGGAYLGRLALATDTSPAAEQVVRGLVERVLSLLASGRFDAHNGALEISLAIEQQADLSLLGRLALGRYWRQATPEQQAQYDALFRRYMLQTFARRINSYAGRDLGAPQERFTITSSRAIGDRDILVHSRLTPPQSPPLQVDWRLRQHRQEPVIIDLIVEGISLLVTQRSEFEAVISRGGMEALLAELRSRVAQPI